MASAVKTIHSALSAPSYLQNAICPVASAESPDLIVPATRRTAMGDRAFAVAAV